MKRKILVTAIGVAPSGVPTPDHYLLLTYVLEFNGRSENLELFNDKLMAGSLSMTSAKIG